MIRDLKVCRKWQGSKNVPSINLQGLYLREHGFTIDDPIRVEVFRNEIRIKKITPQMILKTMTERCPSLEDLIAQFDCVVCD